ncbi:signal peptidase I [Candidatus Saccharibacteria bacterium]|nr:signal peptidase I [Candidatus Saccharibacteria bacterium]
MDPKKINPAETPPRANLDGFFQGLPLPPKETAKPPQEIARPPQEAAPPVPPAAPAFAPDVVPAPIAVPAPVPTAAPVPTNQPAAPQPVAQQIPNKPLTATPIETPRPAAKSRMWVRDVIGLGVFVLVIFVGAMLINSFIFRSFNVIGPSMEPTLDGGPTGTLDRPSDRVIVNLIPVTLSHLGGKDWMPTRGEIIVFKNPHWSPGHDDEYIVKRTIGLPGERVTVEDCELRVHNDEHPDGFNPYPDFKSLAENDKEINTCVDGDGTDVTVPDDAIFVVGDHRVSIYSKDSRDGDNRASLGTVPLKEIVGPVSLRIWPLNQFRTF